MTAGKWGLPGAGERGQKANSDMVGTAVLFLDRKAGHAILALNGKRYKEGLSD